MSAKCTLIDIYGTGKNTETGTKVRLAIQFILTLLTAVAMAIPTAIIFWDTEAENECKGPIMHSDIMSKDPERFVNVSRRF